MKIRSDFVTNSSSSSFALAMGKEFTDKQKKIILDYAESVFFGKTISVPENELTEYESDEWSEEHNLDIRFNTMQRLQELAKEGDTIRVGEISFDDAGYYLAEMYQDLWERLDGVDGFEIVDGDLSY